MTIANDLARELLQIRLEIRRIEARLYELAIHGDIVHVAVAVTVRPIMAAAVRLDEAAQAIDRAFAALNEVNP